MITRVVVRVDDLDGTRATEQVRFSLDAREHEIDLVEDSSDELHASPAAAARVPAQRRR